MQLSDICSINSRDFYATTVQFYSIRRVFGDLLENLESHWYELNDNVHCQHSTRVKQDWCVSAD